MTEEQIEQLKEESSFAAKARIVLNNEAYKQAFTIRKAQIFEIFCNTKQDQDDIREEAWRTMKNLNALEDFFRTALETGNMADAQLKSLTELEDK